MKITKQQLAVKISERTGLTPYKSKKALKTTLWLIRRALSDGKRVDLGKLGKLTVVSRKPARRINKNLRNRAPTIESVYERHPQTVRLLGGKDLSYNPLPTVVHEKPEQSVMLPARRRVAIAIPSWRRRFS